MTGSDDRTIPPGFLPKPIFQAHTDRNKGAIGDVLERHLPDSGVLLEIASGTGQHAVTFGARFPGLTWLTSDVAVVSRESINGWIIQQELANVRAPLAIDVTSPDWEMQVPRPINAMYTSNLLHITPWAITLGLFRGASELLEDEAPLCIYGCFKRDGEHLSEANIRFDANIRRENPEWGVRDLETVADVAKSNQVPLMDVIDMPRENFVLVFQRDAR